MAIPEPSGALWAAVKAISDPWPPDDENAAGELAAGWRRGGTAGTRLGTDLAGAGAGLTGGWSDTAGATAVTRTAELSRQGAELAANAGNASVAAQNYASVLTQTKNDISAMITANEPSYQAIGSYPLGGVGPVLQQAFAAKVAANLQAMVQARAAGLLTGPITGAPAGAAPGGTGPQEPVVPVGATPQQVAAWWKSLNADQRAALLRDHPEQLGNLDGLPAAVRDTANRARLPGERAELQRRMDEARKRLPPGIDPDNPILPAPGTGYDNLLRQVHEYQDAKARLKSLDEIQATLDRPGRALLALDTSGLRVKAAVAVGDVDSAKHVAVFTPGLGSNIDESLSGYDMDMENLRKTSSALAAQHGDGGSVATVTWLGYDAPQLGGELVDAQQSVALDNAAHVGAEHLNGFLNGIGAAHDASGVPLHLTALGHSYGSLTTGLALQKPTPVDDAVIFGSPGLDIHDVHDLKVPDGHVFSEIAMDDHVPDADATGHFGESPYGMPGIRPLSTYSGVDADGGPLSTSQGHSEYLKPGTASQYNIAAVVAGRPDLAITSVPQPAQPGAVPTPPPTSAAPPSAAPPGAVPQPPR